MKGLILILIYLHVCRTENISSIPPTNSHSKTTTLTTTLPITTYNRQIGDITSTSQHGLSPIRYNRKYHKSNKGHDSLQIYLGAVLGILIVFTIVFVIVLFFLRRWIRRNGTGFNNPAFNQYDACQHVNSEFVLSSVSEGQDKYSNHDDDDDDDDDEVRDMKVGDVKSKLTYQCDVVGVGNACNATGHEAQSCPTDTKEEIMYNTGAREDQSQGSGKLVFLPGTSNNRGEIDTIEHENLTKKRRKRHRKSKSSETSDEILKLRNNDHQANNPNELELSEAYQPHQDIKTTIDHNVSKITDGSAKDDNVPVIKDNHSRGLRKSVNLLGDDMGANELLEKESNKIKPYLCADSDNMSNHGIILSVPIDDTRRHPIELPVENMTDIA